MTSKIIGQENYYIPVTYLYSNDNIDLKYE